MRQSILNGDLLLSSCVGSACREASGQPCCWKSLPAMEEWGVCVSQVSVSASACTRVLQGWFFPCHQGCKTDLFGAGCGLETIPASLVSPSFISFPLLCNDNNSGCTALILCLCLLWDCPAVALEPKQSQVPSRSGCLLLSFKSG